MKPKIVEKPGLGSVNENINARTYGVNPYETYGYYDTPFGRLRIITSPLLTEAVKEIRG